ncbi:5'/3'-nucleotidase SurE [Fusibacter sp. JL216-2]|uniref:5'/3'-nucleotidase SurE n=1 Tax=Fusibacter sp. JL216-2 TaxID=3071453 RepID=UPI003D34E4EE
MRILLTNDDGIYAKGLRTLIERLCKEHELYVIAPSVEQSAKSHSITMHHPIMVKAVDLYENVAAAYAIGGTPADCVKIAIEELLDVKPDIVVSGINDGPNLGNDIIYSGTVAAAVEGSFYDVNSVAVSLSGRNNTDFTAAADFIADNLQAFSEMDLPVDTAINVNVPCIPAEDIKGTKVTSVGTRKYANTFDHRHTPRGEAYYWLAGQPLEAQQNGDSDIKAIKEGYISVTPIRFDFSFKALNKDLEDIFKK